MVNTFEENDAGLQLVVDRKGQAAYAEHTQALRVRADSASDLIACSRVLDEWIHWFRKGHIGIGPTEQAQQADQQQKASTPIAATTFPAGRMVKLTEADLVKRLNKADATRHPLEGLWTMGAYRVGIVRQPKDSTRFDSVIVASENKNWKPGEVKVELQRQADGRFAGTFYMGRRNMHPQANQSRGTTL